MASVAARLGWPAESRAARLPRTRISGRRTPTGQGRGQPGPRIIGPNGQRERALSGDVAAKVRAAALAKVDGGTIERVETDADHGSPYEAHVRKSDGTELEVLVNKSFEVTAVNEMQHP